ncbi:Oxidoreductase [Helicostylum pulchrum]|uniref:Mitochondrial intermembrane space import and assembly protein 40 n=1 Tax=Helicostylum pulchrum TaxID=562976 RepID=A0ABP9Y9T2_9FUNG
MSTVVEGKDTVKFVDEEQIERAAAGATNEGETKQEETKTTQEEEGEGEEPASAFNPETGEINWECPCLGGMAQGPCGDEFKAAFSCFVFSEAEPKGLDCVEKFKGMQDCFRLHPDVYGDEIDDNEEEEEEKKTEESPKEEEKESVKEEIVVPSVDEEASFSSWVSSWF